jgi:heat shock protein HslJ
MVSNLLKIKFTAMKYFICMSVIGAIICLSCGSNDTASKSQKMDPHSQMHAEMHRDFQLEQQLEKLNGRWMILQVNNTPIDSLQLDGKKPEIVFDVTKGRFNGTDGCNLFQGKVNFKADKIVFGPLAGTLMACPESETSDKITKSISDKELTYSLNDSLILYDGPSPVMVLQPGD